MSNKYNVDTALSVEWAMLPHLLNTKEASRILNVSISFLAKSRSEGAIGNRTKGPKYSKIGRSVVYKKSELQKWLDGLREHGR